MENPRWIITLSCNWCRWDYVLSVLEELGDNIYSWLISAMLLSLFCSSSCCHACFPTIIRPMSSSWKLILKKILDSPELNCSVVFSLYCLIVLKKIDDFLRDLVRRERRFLWLNVNPLSFIHWNGTRHNNRFSLLWFCFRFWSGCNTPWFSIVTFVIQVDLKELLCCWNLNQSPACMIMKNSDPIMRIIFTHRPDSDFNSVFTVQMTGRDF